MKEVASCCMESESTGTDILYTSELTGDQPYLAVSNKVGGLLRIWN